MALVILDIVAVWLLLSIAASLAFAALSRGRLGADRSRGFFVDRR